MGVGWISVWMGYELPFFKQQKHCKSWLGVGAHKIMLEKLAWNFLHEIILASWINNIKFPIHKLSLQNSYGFTLFIANVSVV